MAKKRKPPKGGWSSSSNQWKTPQSTGKGPKGCEQAALVVLAGVGGSLLWVAGNVVWLLS